MSISLKPFSRADPATLEALRSVVPKGDFYELSNYTLSVPYSPFGYNYVLEVSKESISELVSVTVVTASRQLPEGFESSFSVVPGSVRSLVNIKLAKGINYVSVENTTDGKAEYMIGASTIGLIHEAIAIDIFDRLVDPLNEHEADISNPLSSRLLEWLLPFADILPDVRTPRLVATRVLLRCLLHETSSERGVRDFLAAFGYNNPLFIKQSSSSVLEPVTHPIFKRAQDFGGYDVHVWLPNVCENNRSVFVSMVNNIRELYSLKALSEEEIVYRYNEEFVLGEGFKENASTLQIDRFNTSSPICSLYGLTSLDCMNIKAWMRGGIETSMVFNAAQYGADVYVPPCGALGIPVVGDCGDSLDTIEASVPDTSISGYSYAASSLSRYPISADYMEIVTSGDSVTYGLAIDFPFPFAGTEYTGVFISTSGYVQLGDSDYPSINVLFDSLTTITYPIIAPFWCASMMTALSTGYVRIANRGSYPHRYLIIEWKNYLSDIDTLTDNDTVVFQLILHEQGKIEVVYVPRVRTGTPPNSVYALMGMKAGNVSMDFYNGNVGTGGTSLGRTDWSTSTTISKTVTPDLSTVPEQEDIYDLYGDGWVGKVLAPSNDTALHLDSSSGYCSSKPTAEELQLFSEFSVPAALTNYADISIPVLIDTYAPTVGVILGTGLGP